MNRRRRRMALAPAGQSARRCASRASRTSIRAASAWPSAIATSSTTRTRKPTISAGRATGSHRSVTGASGNVELVEIPTDEEIHDNIVSLLGARRAPAAAQAVELHPTCCLPTPIHRAGPRRRAVATRTGAVHGRNDNSRRVLIDFAGGDLDTLVATQPVKAELSAHNGDVDSRYGAATGGERRMAGRISADAQGQSERGPAVLPDPVWRGADRDLDLSMDAMTQADPRERWLRFQALWRRTAFFSLTFLTAFAGGFLMLDILRANGLAAARAHRPDHCSSRCSPGSRVPSGPPSRAFRAAGRSRSGSSASAGRSATCAQGPHRDRHCRSTTRTPQRVFAGLEAIWCSLQAATAGA